MSCTSPLTVASTMRALALRRRPSPCAARGRPPRPSSPRRTAARTAAASAPEPNSSPTVFMPSSSTSLTISRAGRWASASSRSASSPFRSPSMMRRFSRSHSGSAASSSARLALTRGRVDALEQLEQPLQRVVALAAAGRRPGRARPARCSSGIRAIGRILRGVHDRRVQPGLDALVQEDRVQHGAGGRVEAERDVRDAQRGLHVRVAPLELADRLDGLEPSRRVSSWPVAIGKVRQSTMMSLDAHAPVAGQVLDQPVGDRDLPLGGAGLALARRWSARPPRRRARATSGMTRAIPRVGAVAVLVVDRVDDRAAAEHLQPGLDHRRARSSRARSAGWTAVANRPAISRMSATPSRPT